ncbi:hypothetical protein M0812_28960 [Anaeramoeba flamelloides]|uniref:Uncharacterized protein n=1 Tax=Anaeramoeba flamelloides TaxID=1746091 RepID=A0AAV7Y3Z1_9EUKA|nr:hypothetical protein M0812_28960 [Anaeramoeba flamelloides]
MDDLNDVENQPAPFSGLDNPVKDIELQDQRDLYFTKEEFGTLSPNTKKLYLFKYIDCAVFSRIIKKRIKIVEVLYGVEYQYSYHSVEREAMKKVNVGKNECFEYCCDCPDPGSGSDSGYSPTDRLTIEIQ